LSVLRITASDYLQYNGEKRKDQKGNEKP
jgi:hypothetical protein